MTDYEQLDILIKYKQSIVDLLVKARGLRDSDDAKLDYNTSYCKYVFELSHSMLDGVCLIFLNFEIKDVLKKDFHGVIIETCSNGYASKENNESLYKYYDTIKDTVKKEQ